LVVVVVVVLVEVVVVVVVLGQGSCATPVVKRTQNGNGEIRHGTQDTGHLEYYSFQRKFLENGYIFRWNVHIFISTD
jgi:hypothetical protein